MVNFKKVFLLVGLLVTPQISNAALIPPQFLDAVVSIGLPVSHQVIDESGQIKTVFQWTTLGTGFLYGHLVLDDPDQNKKQYKVYLITAKHVIDGYPKNIDIQVRVNTKVFGLAPQFTTQQTSWFFGDSGIDIAAIGLNYNAMTNMGLQTQAFLSDKTAETKSQMSNNQVSAGDGIFVLGFPMNLAGKDRNYTIVRQGTIARVSDLLDGTSPTFMLDAFVFPGNSGGPVISKPDVTAIVSTKPQLNSALIGMVVSYTTYTDNAVSEQTHRPRVSFEENSGLATVIPVDAINDMLTSHEKAETAAAPVQPTQIEPNQPATP